MTQRSRYFLVASAAVLALGLGGGLIAYLASRRTAGLPTGLPSEVRYVPANAALVAYANVRTVMDSDLHKALMPTIEMGSRKGRQMMNDFAGVDLEKQVDHVLAFIEPSELPAGSAPDAPQDARPRQPPPGMLLVQGTFEQQRIEQAIRSHGGTIDDYNGHRISVHREGPDEIAIGFVRPDLLAIGQARLVRRALDLPNDASAPAQNLTSNTELMSLIRDASGSTAWVVGHFDAVSRSMRLPGAASRQVPPVRLVSAKADVNGGVTATIRAETADQPAADQLREVVRGFVALARLQAASRPEFESALKSIQVSGADKTVQMTFAMSPETMRALAPRPRQMRPDPAPQQ